LQKNIDSDFLRKQRHVCISADTCPHIDPTECAKCLLFFAVYIEEALGKSLKQNLKQDKETEG
jgi:hypothetical protein